MNTDFHDKRDKSEIEAKFICPDGLGLDAFLNVVKILGFQYAKEKPCFQTDIYFDTPRYTLLNSDFGLRIRQRGKSYVGACKSSENQQGPIFERKEYEWTFSRDEINLWNEEEKLTIPPPIIDMLNLHGQALRKVLVVETLRHTATIEGNAGFKAELSLDEVTFRGHKGQKQYRECEVELRNGRVEQLKEVADDLQNQLKLQPAVDSKYKKGMMLVGKHGLSSLQ
ncbi:MAG: CYTH domain-containing protein [Candidatus Brocadia sp.]|nr:CYTH domain-containing protein [Candidatus Brocadia sp.]